MCLTIVIFVATYPYPGLSIRFSMHILTVTSFFPNATNRQRAVFVENLVRAMRKSESVDVVCPIPFVPPFSRRPDLQALRSIPSRERIDDIDVEHPRFVILPKMDWFSGIGYFFGILGALRRWRKRGRESGSLVVHAHCAYPDAVGVALAARLLGIPYFVTAHGSDINVYSERPALRAQIAWALRHATGVIAVSKPIEDKIRRMTGLPPSRLSRIPCAGFDPAIFFPAHAGTRRTDNSLPADARLVVFVGLLVPIKGIEFLIAAWTELHRRNQLRNADRLIIIGDGPCRSDLDRQARNGGIADRVRFVGRVAQAEVARWIAKATILCLPSRNEGTPNVVVEALASGIPVVASKVGGIPDLIREGENGMLVPPAEPMFLADALAKSMEKDWDSMTIANSVADLTWNNLAALNCEFLRAALNRHESVD
jgi:teichuronic acid biosynthesis glycosyltransferase TuaC